jgi:hypothetical protein
MPEVTVEGLTESPKEQIDSEENVEKKVKHTVMVTNIEVSEELLKVINRFANSIDKDIEIIGMTYNRINDKFKLVEEGKFRIFCPTKLPEYDVTKIYIQYISGEDESLKEKAQFVSDAIVNKWIKETPAQLVYCPKNYGTYYAFCIKDEIAFLTDIMSTSSKISNIFMMKELLCHAIKRYKKYDKEAALTKRALIDRRILDGYMYFMRNVKSNARNVYKSQMNTIENDIHTHYQAILKKEKELLDTSDLASTVDKRMSKNKLDSDEVAVSKMMEPLLSSEKYKLFEYTSSAMIGYTNLIKITYKNREYTIGEFKIVVDLTGKITFYNLTSRYLDYDHPHIHDRYACFGNIKETITDLAINYNFMMLFTLLYDYLNKYTKLGGSRPFVHIGWWGGFNESTWCINCDAPKTECICENQNATNVCPECHNHLENCSCNRCPLNRSLLYRNAPCRACGHYHSGDMRCNLL